MPPTSPGHYRSQIKKERKTDEKGRKKKEKKRLFMPTANRRPVFAVSVSDLTASTVCLRHGGMHLLETAIACSQHADGSMRWSRTFIKCMQSWARAPPQRRTKLCMQVQAAVQCGVVVQLIIIRGRCAPFRCPRVQTGLDQKHALAGDNALRRCEHVRGCV